MVSEPARVWRGTMSALYNGYPQFPFWIKYMNRIALRTLVGCLFLAGQFSAAAEPTPVAVKPGDRVVIIGNTLAERMQYFNHWETLLHSRFPEAQLYVRNLGWSADEVALRPRSQDFKDHGHTLADHQPTIVLAMFGFNESFAGPAGLPQFEADLERFLQTPQVVDQYSSTPRGGKADTTKAEVKPLTGLRQIVLVSPIAHEDLGNPHLPDGKQNNINLRLYTEAMARVAAKHGVPFVDLFNPSLKLMQAAGDQKLTINGVHLNAHGDKLIGQALDKALFGERPSPNERADLEKLRGEVSEKNLQFYYDYRAVNGFYIYGGRKNPFGTVNFPGEFEKLRKMTALRDQRVWDVAQGKNVSAAIDDQSTGTLPKIDTNKKDPAPFTLPPESQATFKLPEGFAVNLFASEQDFPQLQNPVQVSFDAKGRLWVCTMPTYPQYEPSVPVHDKLLILEDTNGDGKADMCKVFADGLHVPTGFEFGNGGVFIAQQPNVLFLKDTDGDDKADVRENVLHGFDSADSHHSISAFTYDQGGALYFEEGTFHHSQIESPWGPTRLVNAGVFRYEPRTQRFGVFVSYGFANPWGHIVDGWGQNFVADASGGANYYGTAFSGDVDYPNKHTGMKQFLTKQWRPTAGCELVTSRNFPDDMQGNYLLNNCIGFHGVLQYKMREEASGFAADPVEPLLQSGDQNVRPVDIEFGPDGALYICDWFNPLVGHMQHSLRDPQRDHNHGRIWRIHYKNKPLVTPTKIAGEPIPALLDVLKSIPEERTRYRARIELWNRDSKEVLAAVDSWLAKQDKNDPAYEHHQLEGLWLHQAHDVVNEAYLKRMLSSSEPRARAAATRVLCYWRDRVAQPVDLLKQQVNDQHPRVRLEAVRALSFFHDQTALAAALESMLHPQDDYLTYTLNETLNTLERRIKQREPNYSIMAPLAKLLQDGKVSAERLNDVVSTICRRGNSEELASVFQRAMDEKAYSNDLRLSVFNALMDTAVTRKVKPAGDLTPLGKLIGDKEGLDSRLQQAAVRLASVWKVDVAGDLKQIALSSKDNGLRRAAMDGLIALGGNISRDTLEKLTEANEPSSIRLAAVAGLAKVDIARAAPRAAVVLSESTTRDNPAPLMEAFLNRKGGPDQLAAALESKKPPVDVAKLALRYMYSVGRSDKKLSDVLSVAAGIAVDPLPPTPQEVAQLVSEVNARGDAKRGEVVFRRNDLSCFKCHSLSKAGGDIGPELSSVGAVSPVDYVVNSILNPDLAIKEQFVTKIILTAGGEIHTGIIASRDNVRVLLKEASGKTITIPVADIEEEVEGKSLMPKGLAKFLTHDELIDLVKFISELGKPGDYAIRTVPTIQRWRFLRHAPSKNQRGQLSDEAPHTAQFEKQILGSNQWQPAYSKSAGALPLDELIEEDKFLYLQGELNMVDGGRVTFDITGVDKPLVWIDTDSHHGKSQVSAILNKGKHKLTLRVPPTAKGREIKVQVVKPDGSTAKLEVIGGV